MVPPTRPPNRSHRRARLSTPQQSPVTAETALESHREWHAFEAVGRFISTVRGIPVALGALGDMEPSFLEPSVLAKLLLKSHRTPNLADSELGPLRPIVQ